MRPIVNWSDDDSSEEDSTFIKTKYKRQRNPEIFVPLRNVGKLCVWMEFKDLQGVGFISLVPNVTKVI